MYSHDSQQATRQQFDSWAMRNFFDEGSGDFVGIGSANTQSAMHLHNQYMAALCAGPPVVDNSVMNTAYNSGTSVTATQSNPKIMSLAGNASSPTTTKAASKKRSKAKSKTPTTSPIAPAANKKSKSMQPQLHQQHQLEQQKMMMMNNEWLIQNQQGQNSNSNSMNTNSSIPMNQYSGLQYPYQVYNQQNTFSSSPGTGKRSNLMQHVVSFNTNPSQQQQQTPPSKKRKTSSKSINSNSITTNNFQGKLTKAQLAAVKAQQEEQQILWNQQQMNGTFKDIDSNAKMTEAYKRALQQQQRQQQQQQQQQLLQQQQQLQKQNSNTKNTKTNNSNPQQQQQMYNEQIQASNADTQHNEPQELDGRPIELAAEVSKEFTDDEVRFTHMNSNFICPVFL